MSSIVSRDIRTKDGSEGAFTSLLEVIRSNSNETDDAKKSEKARTHHPNFAQDLSSPQQVDKTILETASPLLERRKNKAHPLLVKIPQSGNVSCYSSDDKLSWADRRTPTSAEMDGMFQDTLNFTPEDPADVEEGFDFTDENRGNFSDDSTDEQLNRDNKNDQMDDYKIDEKRKNNVSHDGDMIYHEE